MKLQEIFDKAARHLMQMDGPSVDADGDACVYRGRHGSCEYDGGLGELNGEMCAVGLFIADEFYDEDFEGNGLSAELPQSQNFIAQAVAKSWGQERLRPSQLRLLSQLQTTHDSDIHASVDQWKIGVVKGLDQIATTHHLRFDPAHINPQYKGDAI